MDKNKVTVFPSHKDERELANSFANFYVSKIVELREILLKTKSSITSNQPSNKLLNQNLVLYHCDNQFSNQTNQHHTVLKCLQEVTNEEVINVTKSLVNKQSILDPIPCYLFKEILSSILPTIVCIVNCSFQLGRFPSMLKLSLVTPVLKSDNLDSDILNNYRPISSLSIVSKIIEKCALNRLNYHLCENNLFSAHQSAYRAHHSCETAVVKVMDDILCKMDSRSCVIMSLLDFSAAFDTVDHDLLIEKLDKLYNIKGTALQWFRSYLSQRRFSIKINKTISEERPLSFGVPQGSILGPVLYSLYVKEIEEIANRLGINVHVYADDIVLYTESKEVEKFKECHKQIKTWTTNNFLKLNNKKTQVLCLSPKNVNVDKLLSIDLFNEQVDVRTTAKYLGVHLDENLSLSKQVNQVCAQGFIMLKNLWKISKKVNSFH